jgi:hypothetical protein
LPDLHAAEQDIVAENDLVVVRLAVSATVKAPLLGVPAAAALGGPYPARRREACLRERNGDVPDYDLASIAADMTPSTKRPAPGPLARRGDTLRLARSTRKDAVREE